MLSRNQRRRLGPQEAAFLYYERDAEPMNVGTVAVFEGAIDRGQFARNIESKLHLVPRYRQRMVAPPFNVGRPTWEQDPEFDIANHVREVPFEKPVTESRFLEIAARVYEGALDRGRPLWEMHLVPGLEGDRTGLIAKVHHCLVDGVSGIELLLITLDTSPEPATASSIEPYMPPPVPGAASLFLDALCDNMLEGLDRWSDLEKHVADLILRRDSRRIRRVGRAIGFALGRFASPGVRAPFNRPLSGGRTLACGDVSFEQARSIRRALGGTVNDVVLATLGGAMSRYLASREEPKEGRTLRVAVPVNVRAEDERDQLGTRVSTMLAEVPVRSKGPLERYRSVTTSTERLKRDHIAEGLDILGRSFLRGPAPLVARVASARLPTNTVANLFCTNVPGPKIQLYTVGHRMLAYYPIAPLLWEMGISVAVTSYNGRLLFSILGEKDVSDVEELKRLMYRSFRDLRRAAERVAKSKADGSALEDERGRDEGGKSARPAA